MAEPLALLSLLPMTAAPAAQVTDDATLDTEPVPLLSLVALAQQGVEPDPLTETASSASIPWGREGSVILTPGISTAYDFNESVDTMVSLQLTTFLVDRVEVGAEIGAWYIAQEGSQTVAGSFSLLTRFHVLESEEQAGDEPLWTGFVDLGIGVLVAGDDVPSEGTSFNFLPRAGVGFTRRLGDDGPRLLGGIRWHHISNARIQGQGENPSRDGVTLYLGLSFSI